MGWLTTDTVKQFLQIGHTREDDALALLVAGAQAFLGEQTGIHLSDSADVDGEVFVEDIDGGPFALRPRRLPIRSVTSITDNDDSGADVTEDYRNNDVRIIREDSTTRWGDGALRWRVTYLGGYGKSGTDPKVSTLKMLILQLVYTAYHGRGDKARDGVVDFRSLADENSALRQQIRSVTLKELVG